MPETISVLHVDDEPDVLELSTQLLERRDPRISVTTAGSGPDGLTALENGRVDCIVSDSIRLPDGESFVEAASRRTDAPIVLFTAKEWAEISADAVAAEVAEYVRKADAADYKAVLRHVLRLTGTGGREASASRSRLIGSHDFDSNGELGVTIVRAVHDVAGGDIDEYDPLFHAVDPDALESLLASGADRHDGDPIEISFTYHGLDLTVRTDGSITTTTSLS